MAPVWGGRAHAQGIEFLSDNGPEYTSHRFRPFVRAMGLIPCHTPRRSPESNGLAEAFFGSFKRDDVYRACLETLEEVGVSCRGGSNTTTPGAAQRLGDEAVSRVLCGVVSHKQASTSPKLSGAVHRPKGHMGQKRLIVTM